MHQREWSPRDRSTHGDSSGEVWAGHERCRPCRAHTSYNSGGCWLRYAGCRGLADSRLAARKDWDSRLLQDKVGSPLCSICWRRGCKCRQGRLSRSHSPEDRYVQQCTLLVSKLLLHKKSLLDNSNSHLSLFPLCLGYRFQVGNPQDCYLLQGNMPLQCNQAEWQSQQSYSLCPSDKHSSQIHSSPEYKDCTCWLDTY